MSMSCFTIVPTLRRVMSARQMNRSVAWMGVMNEVVSFTFAAGGFVGWIVAKRAPTN